MKIKFTEFDKPNFFVDEMLNGSFKYMRHRHEFVQKENLTLMIDHFDFASPLGILGTIVDKLILRKYMTKFLIERNNVIMEFVEIDRWKQVLQMNNER